MKMLASFRRVYMGRIHCPDWYLARVLMRELWQLYDAGGISMGRGLRAGLLESVMWDLYPNLQLGKDLRYKLAPSKLSEILEKKSLSNTPFQLPLFFDLEWISEEN